MDVPGEAQQKTDRIFHQQLKKRHATYHCRFGRACPPSGKAAGLRMSDI
jgi:hypothetical protein